MLHTLAILKPDAVKRKIVGDLISQIENKYNILNVSMGLLTEIQIKSLYPHHVDQTYWPRIVRTMTRGESMFLCILDSTNDFRDHALLLRERYRTNTLNKAENVIHASEPGDAVRELNLFFREYYHGD